jgi:hypothetical protein
MHHGFTTAAATLLVVLFFVFVYSKIKAQRRASKETSVPILPQTPPPNKGVDVGPSVV